MMLASPFWGQLADRVGRKMMVERAIFGGSVLLLIMAFVRDAEQLVLMRAIQGLITGVHSASYALVASQAPREQTGYAMGLLQVGAGAGVSLWPMFGCAVADMYGYRAAFYVTSAMMFLAGLLVLVGVHEKLNRCRPASGFPRQAVCARSSACRCAGGLQPALPHPAGADDGRSAAARLHPQPDA